MTRYIKPKDTVIPDEIRAKWQRMLNILIRVLNIPVALIMKVDFSSFVVFEAGDSSENPFKKR